MPSTFAPAIPPQSGPSGSKKFTVNKIKFGDGYTSRFGEGINDSEQNWPLSWKGTDAEITAIKNFFDAHKGYIAFYWTPPFGVQGLYVVEEYGLVPEAAGNATLNATLVQTFHP